MFFDWRQSHARSRNRILLKSSPSPRPSCRIEQSQNGEITRSLGHVRQNCPAEPINNKKHREKERERERERSFHERTEANVNPITRFPCNRCSASSACPEGESSCCKWPLPTGGISGCSSIHVIVVPRKRCLRSRHHDSTFPPRYP